MSANANSRQVGGSHYADGGDVQHWDFITLNFGPSYLVGCATKYITRHRKKHGKLDLQKALHYIEKLSEGVRLGHWTYENMMCAYRVSPEAFARANKLTQEEYEVVCILSSWRTADDLGLAWAIVDGMIKQAD